MVVHGRGVLHAPVERRRSVAATLGRYLVEDLAELDRYLIESSPVGAWVLAPDGATVWFNPIMCTFLGRSAAELDGLRAHVVFDEQGQQEFEDFLERMRSGQESEPAVECLLYRPDGSTTWVLITASTMTVWNRSLIVLRVIDYDRRRSLNDELIQAQTLGRMGSWRFDYRTGESSWSDELYRVVGRDPAQGPMTFAELSALVVDEDKVLFDRRRAVGAFGNELRIRRPNGDVVWWRIKGRVTGTPGGARETLLATVQEITEQKGLELRLRESLETSAFLRAISSAANKSTSLAATLDLSLQQMLAFDPTARLTTFQPLPGEDGSIELDAHFPGRDYSGLTEEQLTPTARERELAQEAHDTHETIIDDVTIPGSVLVARAVRHRGEVVALVVLTMTDDTTSHERWLAVSSAAAAQAERVMERERVSKELAEARDAAMSASRQKSDFLATMSHEIRTPMNGVIGLNDLLLHTTLDANQRRLAEGVQAAGQALLGVINDILDFSKIEAGKLHLESVDFEVRPLFDRVLAMQGERAHAKGIELAADVHADVPAFVRGDPTRLSQIITNLVSNAVKFTHEGEVIVTCSADVTQSADGGKDAAEVLLRVEVTDTGIGIPTDLQRGLFEPFTQAEDSTSRNFGGTGLGLAICRQLVSAIHGDIGVDSEAGKGSTFWFTGRFAVGDPLLVSASAGASRHILEGRRVLVVDDNTSNRRILTEILREWRTHVESAAGADDAVRRVRDAAARGQAFDVVLLDLVMPDRSGLELASMITTTTDEPWPTMLLLSSEQSVDRQLLESAGIARSLTKPVGRSALFDELVEILADVHGVGALTGGTLEEPVEPLGQRVLVVEDNEINQMVALGVLQALGYSTDIASDGEEAVEMASRTRYDAIVMDVQMPRMDGYAATRAIRAQAAAGDRVPIIAMTAAAVEGESERCLAAGMDAFLTKPLQPKQLEETLRKKISGQPRDEAVEDVDEASVVLDVSRLDLLRAMGPEASVLVRRAVERFVAGADESVTHIHRAVALADGPELRDQAHRLGGSAANLGAVGVQSVCMELERLGEADQTQRAATLLTALERAMVAAVGALRDLRW
jgi:PAS domain S-box-containing protein